MFAKYVEVEADQKTYSRNEEKEEETITLTIVATEFSRGVSFQNLCKYYFTLC